MAPFPNDFNGGSDLPQKRQENTGLSPAREEAAKRQARKWFAILLTIGLSLGALMAIGVVKLLKELRLTPNSERTVPTTPLQKQQ